MEAEVRESRKALQTALNIGAQMLSSGAEISRVEDSIVRMCRAFGAETVECLSLIHISEPTRH